MYLVFTDESGTNKDSTFVLYGGLAIEENSIIKSEMIISDIAKEFFGIKNLQEIEIHFVDIFNYIFFNRLPSKERKKKLFQKEIIPLIEKVGLNKHKLKSFVIELFQFLSKVNATFIVSLIEREDNKHPEGYSFKVFLNVLDNFLNEKNSNGILIADGFYNQISKKSEKINLYVEDTDKQLFEQKELLFKRILFESLSWKHQIELKDSFPLKYKFESKVYNILGNILFIPSHESALIQISDILLYITKKFFEFKVKNNDNLKYFFDNEFEKTLNYIFIKGNIIFATLSNDGDSVLIDEGYFKRQVG